MAGDTTWDTEATLTSSGPGAPEVERTLLVGRYAVGEMIGRGGSGQVHAAVDELTGETVAVKFVRALSRSDQRQLRRELTALRLLDLPGVVRLLDDGDDRGQTFLVMDLLPGGPLSNLAGPFEAWAPAARSLVETLARVHYAGVIHRDLKPGNILLDERMRPVITDFGLAQGQSVEQSGGTPEGTPRYMPPEQWAGRPCDERSDLYALGAVLWELLSGERFPSGGVGRERLLQASGPEALRRVVLQLVEPDPRDRPSSAEVVLEALGGGDAVLGPLPPLPEPVTRPALEALVSEVQPTYLHLAHDTATLLLERSGGDEAGVRSALASWIRAGRCHWHEGLLHIDRAALSALVWESDADGARLAALSRARPDGEVAAAALETSDTAWNAGSPGRALAILESVLPLLDDEVAAGPVRHRLAARALFLNDQASLRRVLYRAQRAADQPLTALLQGARLCGTQEMVRAAEVLRRVVALPDELEDWRIAWLSHALGRLDRAVQAALLDEVEAQCSADPVRRARWLGRRGMARYAAGRFSEALEDHVRASELLDAHPVERVAALSNAAATALETSSLAQAATLARKARDLGRRLRYPVAEGSATLLLRAAEYRAGAPLQARPELVRAAAGVSAALEAQQALVEAAIGWRTSSPAAAELALQAAGIYARLGHRGQGLALGLAASAGAEVDPAEVVRLALAANHGTLSLQAVALGAPERAAEVPVQDWVASWHLGDPGARADVLSLNEVLDRLRG